MGLPQHIEAPPLSLVREVARTTKDKKMSAALTMLATSRLSEKLHKAREEKEQIYQILGEDGLFRFGYVPLVLSELIWSYADTVIDCAATMRLKDANPLSRCIRDLRNEYINLRGRRIHHNQEREIGNMEAFEDAVADIMQTYLLNLRLDIKNEWPDLDKPTEYLLVAAYQCYLLIRSLELYGRRQEAKIARIVGHPVGKLTPSPVSRLAGIMEAFMGNRPASKKFDKLQQKYIEVLATQMALIKLTPIKDELEEN